MTTLLALNWRDSQVLEINLDEQSVRVITDQAGAHPDGITHHDGVVYWTTMGPGRPDTDRPEGFDFTDQDGEVRSIRLDGSDLKILIPVGKITTGKQLTCHDGRLYGGNREANALSSARLDGTGLRDEVKRDGSGGQLDWIVGVAVDPDNGYLYWTQKGTFAGGNGRIFRAGLSIPEGFTAENRPDIETLWTDLPAPIDLHLDVTHNLLYWTDRGHHPGGNSLNVAEIPAPGEPGGAHRILADGFHEAIGIDVDVAGDTAYVADKAGHLVAVRDLRGEHPVAERVMDLAVPLTGLHLLEP